MEDHAREGADKYSLRGQVFNTIRDNILSGKYKINEELKEVTIGNELGVSRTPVREALRQLELEGLVTIIPNKGAYVTGITGKDVQDIYAIRSQLEGLCARWACANLTEEELEELDEIIYLTEFHINRGNLGQMVELDDKFHKIIYDASQSRMLKHILSNYHSYVHRIRRVTLNSAARARACNMEHSAIVQAFKNRDADRAGELAHDHIEKTLQNISVRGLDNILGQNGKERA